MKPYVVPIGTVTVLGGYTYARIDINPDVLISN